MYIIKLLCNFSCLQVRLLLLSSKLQFVFLLIVNVRLKLTAFFNHCTLEFTGMEGPTDDTDPKDNSALEFLKLLC